MLGGVGIHQGRSHVGLADIVDVIHHFLAHFVQRGSHIFPHLGGDGNSALDAHDIVAFGIVGKEVDEPHGGVLHIAVGAYAPEHGGFQVDAGGSGVVQLGNHDHADVLAGGIPVGLQLVGVLVAGPGVGDHGVKGSDSGFLAGLHAPALVLGLQGQLPHIHDVLGIVKAQRGSVLAVQVQAVVAQTEAEVVGRAAGDEGIPQAGGLVHLLGDIAVFRHGGVHRQLQPQLIHKVLAVEHNRSIGAGGDGVDLAVDGAGIQDVLLHVAHVQAAVSDVAVQLGQHAVVGILGQVGVVHLEHVGGLAAGHLGGQLGPVAVPVGIVHDHVDVGIQLLKLFQHRGGLLVTGLGAPPEHVQGGFAFGVLGAGGIAAGSGIGGYTAASGQRAGQDHAGAQGSENSFLHRVAPPSDFVALIISKYCIKLHPHFLCFCTLFRYGRFFARQTTKKPKPAEYPHPAPAPPRQPGFRTPPAAGGGSLWG